MHENIKTRKCIETGNKDRGVRGIYYLSVFYRLAS